MSLLDLLNRRRSVRHYDENQPIDADVVKECCGRLSWRPQVQICSCTNSTT